MSAPPISPACAAVRKHRDGRTRDGRPGYAGPGSAAAVQRPVSRHAHQRRWWLQPLEGPGRDALARRRHLRSVGHVLLSARQRRAVRSGPPRTSPLRSAGKATKRSFRKGARSFAVATAISTSIPISSSLRKTTSSCAGCASPTVPRRAEPWRPRVTRRWCWRLPPRTPCIRRSAIFSCRPRSSRRARPFFAPVARARATSSRRGCFISWPCTMRTSARFPTKPTARASSAEGAPSPRPWRWRLPERCLQVTAPCSIR